MLSKVRRNKKIFQFCGAHQATAHCWLKVCNCSANQITAFALLSSRILLMADNVGVAQPMRLQHLHLFTSRILLMLNSDTSNYVRWGKVSALSELLTWGCHILLNWISKCFRYCVGLHHEKYHWYYYIMLRLSKICHTNINCQPLNQNKLKQAPREFVIKDNRRKRSKEIR